MSTALYTVRCARLDRAHLPDRPACGLAASFKTYRGTGKKAPFAEYFPKTAKLFSVAEDEAAYAAVRAAGDASSVLRVVEHFYEHRLKRKVLEGVDVSAALAAMERSATVAASSPTLLGQRALAWTQYLLHRVEPTRIVAPAFALVKLG